MDYVKLENGVEVPQLGFDGGNIAAIKWIFKFNNIHYFF